MKHNYYYVLIKIKEIRLNNSNYMKIKLKRNKQQNNENASNTLHNIIQTLLSIINLPLRNPVFFAVWDLKLRSTLSCVPLYIDYTHFPTGHYNSKFLSVLSIKMGGM